MAGRRALAIWAGPKARQHLRERGLKPEDIRLIPAAAGGPKGLILNPLDRYLFGHWFQGCQAPLHLVGASIGAWRMAAACARDADAALAHLADGYIGQSYPDTRGRRPSPTAMSRLFDEALHALYDPIQDELLAHPSRRLHIVVSRGRGLLAREGRLRTPLGYGLAFGGNALSRRMLGGFIERVVFSDPRTPLPLPLDDLRGSTAPLTCENIAPALLATASIPFWLDAVREIPGARPGAFWDGGITDYHLHLRYDAMPEGLVLYPHFQPELVPGWLDKGLRRRHRATPWLDNVIVLHPDPAWIATLPGAKLPDRSDFMRHLDRHDERQQAWRRAVGEAGRLADEAARWLEDPQVD